MVSADILDCDRLAAIARHVCAEGCQLILGRGDAAPGQRFHFELPGFGLVSGTVQWVLKDRVGFAFDKPLCRVSEQVLNRQGGIMASLELVPA